MTKEYPYILLIRLLSFFNYKSGILQFNGKNISVNKICKLMNFNSTEFTKAMKILEGNNLAKIESTLGTKLVVINTKIITGIENSKEKKLNLANNH